MVRSPGNHFFNEGDDLNSKFFTPALTKKDRLRFIEALGLSEISYFYYEISGQLVLRALQITGGNTKPMLEPIAQDPKESERQDQPSLTLFHPPCGLWAEKPHPARTLWEEVFPYPMSLIARFFLGKEAPHIQILPPSYFESWRQIWKQLQDLETKMASVEVSLLWIPGERAFPLLFHFVRRKWVRVGTSETLMPLGAKLEHGELDNGGLTQHFGTQAAFFVLGLAQ